LNNSKIVSIKTTSTIFLAIVLVTGTFALSYPLFMIEAQATSDREKDHDNDDDKKSHDTDRDRDKDDKSRDHEKKDNDRQSYGKDNSIEVKIDNTIDNKYGKPYENDNNYYQSQYPSPSYKSSYIPQYQSYDGKDSYNSYKSTKDSSKNVNIKKIKCNNINLNINNGQSGTGNDSNGNTTSGNGNTTDGFKKINRDGFTFICINNNENARQGERPTPTEPPTEPPVEELATLKVSKAIPCFTNGPDPRFFEICDSIHAAISPDLFDISVSGNNPDPSSPFSGSSAGTDVTLGPGNYQISETADSSVNTIINNLESTEGAVISDFESIFNGDCTKQGDHFATGTITEGETKHCVINNGFTVESINTLD
jgi:hypothetical protein